MNVPTNYQPSWATNFTEVTVAESTRHGGVSPVPYRSLNLGLYTKDDVENVRRNQQIFCQDLAWEVSRIAGAHQVHGNQVLRVNQPGQWEGYDALVTNRTNVLLTVTIADCTPILIYDPVHQAVGAIHAGWRGTVANIVEQTFRFMRDAYASCAEDCWAYIGTCIDGRDFEVDADVADHFSDQFKLWNDSKNKFLVDLKEANRQQLLDQGFQSSHIEVSPYSTLNNNDHYFSHRAELGKTGRMLAVIGLKP